MKQASDQPQDNFSQLYAFQNLKVHILYFQKGLYVMGKQVSALQ